MASFFTTAKDKVISISILLSSILVITTFFNVDIPANAYISDIEASEQRSSNKLEVSRITFLEYAARGLVNDIKATERLIRGNISEMELYNAQQKPVPQYYIDKGADLKSEQDEFKDELKRIRNELEIKK